jgi:DNA mismatch endonuclease (patch repair protein)
MSRIKGMNTSPEEAVRRCAYTRGLRYRTNVMSMPGRPDMVFVGAHVVVHVLGDFWHGWQFPRWGNRLSAFWRAKIERNRSRDHANDRKLRSSGWTIVRLWEHEVKANPDKCVDRIVHAISAAGRERARPGGSKGRSTRRRSTKG